MKRMLFLLPVFWVLACSRKSSPVVQPTPPLPSAFSMSSVTINGASFSTTGSGSGGKVFYNIPDTTVLRFTFTAPLDEASVTTNLAFKNVAGGAVAVSVSFAQADSVLIIQPSTPLQPLAKYSISLSTYLQSQAKGNLLSAFSLNFISAMDTTDKFPRITDSALLDLVESQTFAYFWSFGHPHCGMARERNSSGDVVTTGGSGFGVMAMLAAIQRNFISRAQGLGRIDTIVSFLINQVTRYHGAFPHWINGATGATVPFSTQDDGGDLVETSYMLQGLLTARQYFNSTTDNTEIQLRTDIDTLWNGVDWNWYRQNGQNTLYWNWSPDYNWAINFPVKGWDEALIAYVLAASASPDSIPKSVYDNGWAGNGSMANGNSYYGIQLPLGPDLGGPLFFAHYSFLGINPNGLSDAYANYWTQNTAHAQINYAYCVQDPMGYNGYGAQCWGLTASDDNISGYSAHSPTNDLGIISPTAAISSLPYTPTQSMAALRFFYYKLGNKIWGQYGFADAFNLSNPWFANSYLAIDQGPEIVMIENYRSGLLWNLFMSCPEIKTGMHKLGFQSPNL